MPDLLFLGPKGTYSEIGAKRASDLLNCNCVLRPVSTISKIVETVNKNSELFGILPFENSIEGIVRQTIDSIYLSDVKIVAEIDIKIEHCLISKFNDISKIKHIVSHPQALAQCSRYILDNFDENIDLITEASTAKAAELLLKKDETFGAIASSVAAKDFELNILAKNIGDIKENKTRFVLVSKKEMNLGKKNRTSIAFNTKNEPGALLKILQILYKHNLSLSFLESRPSKKIFGEYNFFADIDCSSDEENLAFIEIKNECNYFKFLGSYPFLEKM